MSQLFVRTGIHFSSSQQALEHIGAEMLARGVVHDSYPAALLEREATFPTGIALEKHAVAIPHCEAIHAKSPAIYLIRPDMPVSFQRADDDGEIDVSLIIALIVENPKLRLHSYSCCAGYLVSYKIRTRWRHCSPLPTIGCRCGSSN